MEKPKTCTKRVAPETSSFCGIRHAVNMDDMSQPKPIIKDVYRFAIISLFVTLMGTIFGLFFYNRDGSSLCLVYGIQSFVTFMSNAVILWRCFVPDVVDADLERALTGRELRSIIAINLLMIVSGTALVVVALVDISRGIEAQDDMKTVVGISFIAAIVFGLMTAVKFRLADSLDSRAVHQDAVCSLTGTALALALFFDSWIIQHRPEAWWLDPTVAFLAGLTSLVYGSHAVIHARFCDNVPFCNLSWWALTVSRGLDEEIIDKHHVDAGMDPSDVIDLTEYEEDIDEIYL